MEKSIQSYIGIDVSKAWFDASILTVIDHQKQAMASIRFDNTTDGIKKMDKWFKQQGVVFGNTLMVIENTGIYHRLIWEYCSVHNLPIHIGNAAHIKWSFGIARGKNDLIDSQRLCGYAFKHADELRVTPKLDPVFIKLKDLSTARNMLIDQITTIVAYLNELKLFNSKETQKLIENTNKAAVDGLKKSIAQIEGEIKQIIKEDPAIKQNYDLLLSVPGVGHITAVYIICCTNNFITKISGKQLACYAGVVPFSNTSGTSIKGRNKVHRMANKDLKKLLHMCALTAITHYPEFKQYYKRKKEEGKHALSIINAVKNKIVLRVVAVINKQEKYVNKQEKTQNNTFVMS